MRSNKGTWVAALITSACLLIVTLEYKFCTGENINDQGAEPVLTGNPTSTSVVSAGAAGPKFHVEFKTEPVVVQAGESANLVFKVRNNHGVTVSNLLIHHEKFMHLLIVSDDMEEFYHLHPEPQSDGSHIAAQTFSNGGAYKIFAGVLPLESVQVIEKLDLQVEGAGRKRSPLPTKPRLTGSKDGLRVALSTGGHICPGEDVTLGFKVTEPKTGAQVRDLQRYLGEFAHFIIISKDFQEFLHAHPSSEEAGPGDHNGDSPSEIFAQTSFPKEGVFKIWAQFKRNEQVITIPFIINVSPSGCGTLAAKAENEGAGQTNAVASGDSSDVIKVKVNRDGYTPDRIEVKNGQPVKLAFYRDDARNCGGTIVFPALNIRRKLLVGKQVIVEVTPREAGDLSFTCGMGMLKGKLVVK